MEYRDYRKEGIGSFRSYPDTDNLERFEVENFDWKVRGYFVSPGQNEVVVTVEVRTDAGAVFVRDYVVAVDDWRQTDFPWVTNRLIVNNSEFSGSVVVNN